MNGFMAYVLIAILIFLRSMANSAVHESIFHHCVTSAGYLIILASCYAFVCDIATIMTPFYLQTNASKEE
jgi:hypothetical protein